MYLFLNPQTSIIVQNWNQIVKPHMLLKKEQIPIDNRSYRERIEDRLDVLAKKYKELYANSKNPLLRTKQMIKI